MYQSNMYPSPNILSYTNTHGLLLTVTGIGRLHIKVLFYFAEADMSASVEQVEFTLKLIDKI